MAMEDPKILNVRDAAKFLRISESIIRRLIREQRIPFFKIERRYLFSRPVIENWVKELSITPNNDTIEVDNNTSQQIWNKVKG
jgi:excisionase family DNA binding protein